MPLGMTCTVRVNRREIQVGAGSLKAEQILELAGLSPDEYDLFRVSGQDSEKLDPGVVVEIEDGMQCNAILKSVPYG